MIALTRLNSARFFLNDDLIQTVEATPTTVVRLTNGESLVVLEKPEEIVDLIAKFRSRCMPAAGAESR